MTKTGWSDVAGDLERLLRLRSIPFAMKLFERREDMEAIARIRRLSMVHTLDQIVGQASRLGWIIELAAKVGEALGRTGYLPNLLVTPVRAGRFELTSSGVAIAAE